MDDLKDLKARLSVGYFCERFITDKDEFKDIYRGNQH